VSPCAKKSNNIMIVQIEGRQIFLSFRRNPFIVHRNVAQMMRIQNEPNERRRLVVSAAEESENETVSPGRGTPSGEVLRLVLSSRSYWSRPRRHSS
jgi:hypothetical protein